MKFLDIQQSAVAPRKQSIVGWYVKFDVRTLRRQKRENHTTSDVLLKCTIPRIFPFLTLWYNTNWKWVVNRYFATENMILRCLDSETTPDLLKTWKYVCEKCYLHLEPSRTITCIYYNLYDDMHTWYSRTIMNDHELSQQSTTKRWPQKRHVVRKKACQCQRFGPEPPREHPISAIQIMSATYWRQAKNLEQPVFFFSDFRPLATQDGGSGGRVFYPLSAMNKTLDYWILL